MVHGTGLEPARLTAPGPKPGASTNFATHAMVDGAVDAPYFTYPLLPNSRKPSTGAACSLPHFIALVNASGPKPGLDAYFLGPKVVKKTYKSTS